MVKKASVVIPSRGGAERLPRLLSALAAQTYPRWEAIIVIDGDVDNSTSVVAKYAHLPIHSIVFPENRGRVAALNAGHEAASGEVLIRCDDDLLPGPSYVADHVAMHAKEQQAVVGLTINVLPENYYARAYGRPNDLVHRQEAYASATPWRHWAGNVSLTRDTWETVGPYDLSYRAYGWEDVDYGYRLMRAGIKVTLAPELETIHLAASTTCSVRTLRAFHSGAAAKTFERLHGAKELPSPLPQGGNLWPKLVRGLGARSRHTLTLLARVVDVVGPALPTPAARKLIALLAEAGTLSGYLHAEDVSNDV